MSLLKAFDNFAPLSDSIPSMAPHAFHLESTAIRARKLLSTRYEKQIYGALDTLHWILEEGLKLQEKTTIEKLSNNSDQDIYPHSDTSALKLYMPLFDIKGQSTFSKATWAEYFAILALAKIGIAIDPSNTNDESLKKIACALGVDPDSIAAQRENLQIEFLLEATEATRTAEDLAEALRQKQKATSIGGVKRAAKYEQLKDFTLTEWEKNYQHLSNSRAATMIWRKAPSDLKAVSSAEEPELVLARWIGTYKNS